MTDPLRTRNEAAVRAYRETGDLEHLAVLDMDGLPDLSRDLTLERYASDPAPYTARVDAWLGR